MTRLLALLTGLLVATTASAMKGDELSQLLDAFNRANGNKSASDHDALAAGQFAGYVRGVEDSLQGFRFCITPKATFNQRVALITKYVKAHPDELNNGATTLIVQALQPVYPCQGQ